MRIVEAAVFSFPSRKSGMRADSRSNFLSRQGRMGTIRRVRLVFTSLALPSFMRRRRESALRIKISCARPRQVRHRQLRETEMRRRTSELRSQPEIGTRRAKASSQGRVHRERCDVLPTRFDLRSQSASRTGKTQGSTCRPIARQPSRQCKRYCEYRAGKEIRKLADQL